MNESTKQQGGTEAAGRDSSVLLSAMTDTEKKAAARFNETTEDGEGYDVPKPMMRRLRELGLVRHCGGGWYEQTTLMQELEDALHQYVRSQNCGPHGAYKKMIRNDNVQLQTSKLCQLKEHTGCSVANCFTCHHSQEEWHGPIFLGTYCPVREHTTARYLEDQGIDMNAEHACWIPDFLNTSFADSYTGTSESLNAAITRYRETLLNCGMPAPEHIQV